MCSVAVNDVHGHIVDVKARGMLCVCRPCYLLFTPDGAGHDHFRAVPERRVALGRDQITAQQWDRLEVPVSVAFFFHNSEIGHVVALYPGPGGATESTLPLETWDDLVASVPVLTTLEPDVEAVLVRGERGSGNEAFIVPIDSCYELTGQLRSVWRGIAGGSEAREAIDTYFAELTRRAKPAGPVQ